MRYVSVAEGRTAGGLRLVLTAGVPGPWGESAKAIMKLKGLAYTAVLQQGGGENPELLAWTGQASAPVAVYADEPPRSDSLDILFLAERLAPLPRLIPEDVGERVAVLGLAREIIGRHGIGWARRVMMLAPMMQQPTPPPGIQRLASRYGCGEQAPQAAALEVARILEHLAAVLARQHTVGSRYFVGRALSAVDVYWACFSNMLAPLPAQDCATPPWMRQAYGDIGEVIAAALQPSLIAHRDLVFAEHIGLPLDFAIDPAT